MWAIRLDDERLYVDPARLAPEGAACDAAKAAFRTAHTFRILFTTLVFIFSAALLLLLVLALALLAKGGHGWEALSSGAGVIVSGSAVGFLGARMNQSIRVERRALADVKAYCGDGVAAQLR
jgi:hypothetical protein